jgi:hypothetical protein
MLVIASIRVFVEGAASHILSVGGEVCTPKRLNGRLDNDDDNDNKPIWQTWAAEVGAGVLTPREAK